MRPEALVLLGATAGKALLAPLVSATAHPSSILRQRDDASRHAERRAFTEDLERIAAVMNGGG